MTGDATRSAKQEGVVEPSNQLWASWRNQPRSIKPFFENLQESDVGTQSSDWTELTVVVAASGCDR